MNPRSLRKDDLYWQNNLNTHVFPLMHDLAVDDYLMHTNSVVNSIRWVSSRRDLNLAPLAVSRHNRAFECAFLKFLVDPLLINTAFSLDQG
jgi:hypothetical protein